MNQMLIVFCLALVASVSAKPALLPAVPAASPFGYPPAAAPFAAYTAAGPLAVSSSQRLDYFNQFNAAFAPPARLVATPTGVAAVPAFPAPGRFVQPARLFAPGAGPFYF